MKWRTPGLAMIDRTEQNRTKDITVVLVVLLANISRHFSTLIHDNIKNCQDFDTFLSVLFTLCDLTRKFLDRVIADTKSYLDKAPSSDHHQNH